MLPHLGAIAGQICLVRPELFEIEKRRMKMPRLIPDSSSQIWPLPQLALKQLLA